MGVGAACPTHYELLACLGHLWGVWGQVAPVLSPWWDQSQKEHSEAQCEVSMSRGSPYMINEPHQGRLNFRELRPWPLAPWRQQHGRIKGAKCPFDLQFLPWDFSRDAVAGKGFILR